MPALLGHRKGVLNLSKFMGNPGKSCESTYHLAVWDSEGDEKK